MQHEGAMDESDAVRMTGISKSFGGVQALADVDLTVRYGEVHALLGENGAGKSTLLKILRGVLASQLGQIEIGGKRLREYNADTVRRAGVAMIFQEMSLIPTLSVAQNIFLIREPHGRLGLDRRRTDRSGDPQIVRRVRCEHRP